MSIQFGRWNFTGGQGQPEDLHQIGSLLAPYGSDSEHSYSAPGIHILFRAFHTTADSLRASQPYVGRSGSVITWDGRLDNREELLVLLASEVDPDTSDAALVTGAYERWGTDSLAKLIGDWALSVWDPRQRLVILAKDFLGTRPLYYSIESGQLTWSTVLDPLVLLGKRSFPLHEEYVAGWLSYFPAADLTPYNGIHSVPPSSFVRVGAEAHKIRKYWDCDPAYKIRYRSDNEYEEHFRNAFRLAVRRRLRSHCPVLAELSGGMDSSAIVCVADTILAEGATDYPSLHTVSYFDRSEPNWNELPYFTMIEERRGKVGCHIDIDREPPLLEGNPPDLFAATPASRPVQPGRLQNQLDTFRRALGNRVMLSGVGGDEVAGGVPTPIPELMDLLVQREFRLLGHQLKRWALDRRKPWFHLLLQAFLEFLPPRLAVVPKHKHPPNWLCRDFAERNMAALAGYPSRVKLFGALPSFQENLVTLAALRRQLACAPLPTSSPLEVRYPFLDRDFLQFIYAVPRNQLVRPGQRRSLMRRALLGIVPDQILNRRRKAFVTRRPLLALSNATRWFRSMDREMMSSLLGFVNPDILSETLRSLPAGQEIATLPILRLFHLEQWLRHLSTRNILRFDFLAGPARPFRHLEPNHRTCQGVQTMTILRNGLSLALVLAAALLGLTGQAQDKTRTENTPRAYHHHASTAPLPDTLDPHLFTENHGAFVAYSLAAQIEETLYEVPCYCGCDREEHHESLLDCFTGKHGVHCHICQKETVFCFLQNRKGKSPAQIRAAMAKGGATKLNLEKYTKRFYPRHPYQ